MRRLLLAIATLAATCAPGLATAQVPPPVRLVTVSTEARAFLDSIATDSFTHRVETGGCITGYIVTDSSLVITRISGANYQRADSISMQARFPGMCPWGQPIIHSHIDGMGSPFPSYPDMLQARIRGTWNAILNVSGSRWFLLLY